MTSQASSTSIRRPTARPTSTVPAALPAPAASGVVVSLIEPAATKDARKMQREVRIDTPIGSPDVRAPGADDRTRRRAGAGAGAGIGIETSAGAEAGERPPDRHGHHIPRRPRLRLHRRRPRQGLFVHQTNITTKVSTGQQVEFGVRPGRKGLEAFDVVPV